MVRYKGVTSGILLAGEPGRWYVTFFHFLRAEFGLICHGAGLAEVGRSSHSRHRRRVCVQFHTSFAGVAWTGCCVVYLQFTQVVDGAYASCNAVQYKYIMLGGRTHFS